MSRRPVKVLLVEDEDAIKDPLTKYLTHTCNCQVDAVKDADGAFTRLGETHGNFDMALIDDLLVPQNGREPEPMGAFLTREFKTRYPEMEIIVFTGRGMDSALEALRAGAYRYLTKPLNYEELEMLIQTAVEHRRLKGIAREKQILEQLMETSTALLSGHGLSEMLETILHGIQALGYDRVCLYLVSDDGQALVGRAQVGFENNLVGHTRPIASDTYMQRLIADPRPLLCERNTDPPLMYEEVMDRQDVDQWACIPLVLRGNVIGKISIDNKYSRQPILESELKPIALFASQAAETIEHTRLYEQVAIERDRSRSKADQLFALHEIAKQMQLQLDLKSLLDLVSYQAATLLGADSGGILLLDDDKRSLTFRGGYGLGERILKGTRDGLGRSIAGRVAKQGEAIVANDIPNDPRFENPAADEEGFLAIISTPLWVDGEIIGTLDVHSKRDRQAFNDQDLQILSLMASQAAVAIETANLLNKTREQALDNADLAARDANKLRRLEKLTIAYSGIMGNLAEMGLDERLNLIAKHATEILEAQTCAIFLVKRSGFLSLEASYGHREGHFIKGREFAIRTGIKTGLNGHIAYDGKLFNSHGDALFNHIAARRMPYHGSADDQYSVLAIPLKQLKDGQEKLIGMLRVDNKRDASGQPGLQIKFGQEDEWILSLFADAVTVAIEGAELVDQFREQKDHWARLVASSPNAIIAIDVDGKIESINAEAQKILRYRPDEVLGKSVKEIYGDVKEARRVSKLLYEASDGRLFNYETFVNSKDRERIPIRLAATQLINAQGDRIGSVGYFEDLRSIKVSERRLELLLKVSNTVAQAENLPQALQSLAQMLVTFLDVSFCRSFLFSDDKQYLLPHAAYAVYPQPIPSDQLDWNIGPEEQQITINDYPHLSNILDKGIVQVLRADNSVEDKEFLANRSHSLGLKQLIQSLLLIPLKTVDKVVGLLALGEMRSWDVSPVTEQKQELAIAIADQTAMMIERVRLLDTTTRHNKLLVALDEASRHIRAENEEFKLLQGVVRLAAEIVNFESGGIYTYRPHLNALELEIVYELPETLMGSHIPESEGIGGLVAQTGSSQKIDDYQDWSKREPFFEACQFKTVVGVPLINQTGDVEAVLFIADSTGTGRFTKTDIDILERFAVQASIALRTSKLMSREQRMTGRLDVLYKISHYIQTTTTLDKVLHAVLTGVTAGYGLSFNRAALLLLNEKGDTLVGRMGIGHLDYEEAYNDWQRDRQEGLWGFVQYLKRLEEDSLADTPIGFRIRDLQLPVQEQASDIFSRVIFEGKHRFISEPQISDLPSPFIEAFQPDWPLVVAPLMSRDRAIGLLVADNMFTHDSVTEEDVDALLTFAYTAAVAIDNTQLLSETNDARERLNSFFEASNALISSQNPHQVLEDIVEKARLTAKAIGVSLILVDQMGRGRYLVTAGINDGYDLSTLMRPNGNSVKIFQTGQPVILEDMQKHRDCANPSAFERGIGSAIGLPVVMDEKTIGVMWIDYERPRYFSEDEIASLRLYVNQATLAYDSARRINQLNIMHQAVAAVASVEKPQQVLKQIVRYACEVLEADSASVSSYEPSERRFTLRNSVATDEISSAMWQRYAQNGLWCYHIDEAVLNRGWIGIENVDEDSSTYLEEAIQPFYQQIEAKSFQGVSLVVEGENLGLLYVNYNYSRMFSNNEQEFAKTFANHAALALKRAKLLDQLDRTRNTAHIVAEVTALGNLDDTLRSVVEGTVGVVGCDAVTLYVYDPDQKRLGYPPTMIGVRYEDRALQLPQVPSDSIVRKMLEEEQPFIVEEASVNPDFKDLRFTRDEEIETFVAIPLKAGIERVGVMFVNYRRRHRFTDDEFTNMKLFAYQAAVAIRNAQLYDQLTARYEEMRRIKAYVGAHTAVDWLKMVSTAWGHNIRREVGIVLGRVALLQNLLNADPHASEVQEELRLLKEAVKHIKEIPIIAPLSYEDAIHSIQVNDIIKKYLDRQWKHNRYKCVELRYDLQPDIDDLATVWASQEWLRHGLEIVVDNAVWAMQRAKSPAPKITVRTRLVGDRIEISVMDSGPGIPQKIANKLFKEPIPKPEGSRGAGIGLMLAQTIFQTYRGDIRVGTTGRTGTTMLINLPIESQLGS